MAAFRGRLLIAGIILLIISVTGAVLSFNLPEEIEQDISLLNYEHMGQFDYTIYQKSSYLFDDIPFETEEPVETPESTEIPTIPSTIPRFPIESTNRVDFTFNYDLQSEQSDLNSYSSFVQVKAIFKKPDDRSCRLII